MSGPVQIIQTSDADQDCFVLHEENLNKILEKIPADHHVAIVAVVGAFRTGKSFLLNFFLRYLRASTDNDASQAWMISEGEELSEGNMNEGWSMVEDEASKKEMSFKWRGGEQRQTTGIWMWSEPFFRKTKLSNGESLAVLLMDTQGMFDNETTMTLTAQIFGLSTLVSSFQIYNVDKRIQEDNLQHLALFSEYGRMALLPHSELQAAKDEVEQKISSSTDASKLKAEEGVEKKENAESTATAGEEAAPADTTQGEATPKPPQPPIKKPFQRLQFLVRDWQNFDNDYKEGDSMEVFQRLHDEMQRYLSEVLRNRNLTDLQSTREQITRCFDKLDCFLLPHPGFAVVRKNYDGSISKIEPFFRALVNQYVRFIFDEELEAKVINNRKLTALELKNYFEVYVKMFQAGEKSFPKAMTMLEATAEANNRNAYDLGLNHYKKCMELVVGADMPFVKEKDLTERHEKLHKEALEIFDEIATMGAEVAIEKARDSLIEIMEAERKRYFTTNALRNPFKDLEFYLLPLAIASIAWIVAVATDITCSTDFCERVEDTFVNVYMYIIFITIVLTWKQITSAYRYIKEILPDATAHVQQALSK